MNVSQYSRCHWSAGHRHGEFQFYFHAETVLGAPHAFATNWRNTYGKMPQCW